MRIVLRRTRYLPQVFTEQGRWRTFVRLREMLATHKQLWGGLAKNGGEVRRKIRHCLRNTRRSVDPPPKAVKRPMGFLPPARRDPSRRASKPASSRCSKPAALKYQARSGE